MGEMIVSIESGEEVYLPFWKYEHRVVRLR